MLTVIGTGVEPAGFEHGLVRLEGRQMFGAQ
jgi:hypothetical protein